MYIYGYLWVLLLRLCFFTSIFYSSLYSTDFSGVLSIPDLVLSLSRAPSKSRLVRLSTIVSASRPDSHLPRCQFHSRPTAASFPVTIRLQRYQTGFSYILSYFTMAATEKIGTQNVRRWSSMDPSRADLYGGPSVTVPPRYLMASSATEHHEDTMHMDFTRQHLEEEFSSDDATAITPRMGSPVNNRPPITNADDFALAFDIDGVLVKGGQPIPSAVEALRYINGENPYGVKV